MQPRITYIAADGAPVTRQFSAAAYGTKNAWDFWDEVCEMHAAGQVLVAVWLVGAQVTRTIGWAP